MSEIDLSNIMSNLSVNEISTRDQEPDNSDDLKIIIRNTIIVSNFFNKTAPSMTPDVIIKFMNTNIFVFKMYLSLKLFTQNYENVPQTFLLEIHTIKEGLRYFLKYYNEKNISYNMVFIRNFNSNLYSFIIHHGYETGFLL
jgi:hypothetical protein